MNTFLYMPVSDVFGAGTCGKYLLKEFAKKGTVYIDPPGELTRTETGFIKSYLKPLKENIDIPLIQFNGPELGPQTRFKGAPTVGYIFNEWENITNKQKENLKRFDVLAAGSSWNAKVIRESGFECASVPQGVDRTIFYPRERKALKDKFVIYSGGKFEPRKSQDLVIKSVKVLQERHDDIILMASWFNIWDNRDFYDMARNEGLKIIGLPLYNHEELAERISQSDMGLFPNRCEGGTNLVMMDYLACGKPVAANGSTGQSDVLHADYSWIMQGNDESLVEQMINAVEDAYENRDNLEIMGREADLAMNRWPWSKTADGLEKVIHDEIEAYAEGYFQ